MVYNNAKYKPCFKIFPSFQQACTSQENLYNELMREREEYVEEQRKQKLEEIRLKIATRTIVKFIEDHYPAWKKKKLKSSKKKKKYKNTNFN